VPGSAPCDLRPDTSRGKRVTIDGEAIAAIGEQPLETPRGCPRPPALGPTPSISPKS